MAGKQGSEILKTATKWVKDLKGYDRNARKVRIISAGSGKCTAELTVEQEHTNAIGTMHGAFSATLVDIISLHALKTNEGGKPGVSVDMHIRYLKAANIGDEVLIEANTLKAGKTFAYLDVAIKNKKTGQLLVTGTHTMFII